MLWAHFWIMNSTHIAEFICNVAGGAYKEGVPRRSNSNVAIGLSSIPFLRLKLPAANMPLAKGSYSHATWCEIIAR